MADFYITDSEADYLEYILGEDLELGGSEGRDFVQELLGAVKRRDTLALGVRAPQRLAHTWLAQAGVSHPALRPDAPMAELKDKDLDALGQDANQWLIHPSGTEGYAKAEVTAGGVSTRDISSQTMESKHLPGLHFIGEVMDVTGWLGGYNFQWAWASAMACAQALTPANR